MSLDDDIKNYIASSFQSEVSVAHAERRTPQLRVAKGRFGGNVDKALVNAMQAVGNYMRLQALKHYNEYQFGTWVTSSYFQTGAVQSAIENAKINTENGSNGKFGVTVTIGDGERPARYTGDSPMPVAEVAQYLFGGHKEILPVNAPYVFVPTLLGFDYKESVSDSPPRPVFYLTDEEKDEAKNLMLKAMENPIRYALIEELKG